jgi:tRNA-splicing ligase RtcB
MGTDALAELRQWLAMPMEPAAREAVERVRRATDVVHVAVMPDVHVAGEACVGMAVATRRMVYPGLVGGDIGCGMLAKAFAGEAARMADAESAGRLLRGIGEKIPSVRRHRAATLRLPERLDPEALSHPALRGLVREVGILQFGTLGRGNHFIELQADGDGQLWSMIHSGSRAVGQAVKRHHVSLSTHWSGGIAALDMETDQGRAYLADQEWARSYAEANREAMGEIIAELLRREIGVEPIAGATIRCDHNHVRREMHFGDALLVHRKGAMPADAGLPGVVPGSMGTRSFHVVGRGYAEALRSSAHGAGRLYSRQQARRRFGLSAIRRQMHGVWFDPWLAEALREESPGAYKDVNAVLAAEEALVEVMRTLRPVVVYKGRM